MVSMQGLSRYLRRHVEEKHIKLSLPAAAEVNGRVLTELTRLCGRGRESVRWNQPWPALSWTCCKLPSWWLWVQRRLLFSGCSHHSWRQSPEMFESDVFQTAPSNLWRKRIRQEARLCKVTRGQTTGWRLVQACQDCLIVGCRTKNCGFQSGFLKSLGITYLINSLLKWVETHWKKKTKHKIAVDWRATGWTGAHWVNKHLTGSCHCR